MKTNVWKCAALVAVMAMGGCDFPIDDGGGGGGGGAVAFNRGFVFLRADDKNIYAADQSDYQGTLGRLTTTGNNKHPSLSKNGRQVVFVNTAGGTSSLQTVAISGGAPRTVLSSDGTMTNFANPVFSPDGAQIAFTFERSGSSYLAVVNADGSDVQELSSGVLSYGSPSFFADGNSVLVAAGNLASGYTQLEKVNIDTGTAENLLNGLGNEATVIKYRVVVSPDGTKAAFDGQLSTGATRIFVADLATRAVTQLTDYPGDASANDSFPTWVSNTEVGFSSDTGGNDQVYTQTVTAMKQPGSLKLPSAVEPWFGP